MTGICQKKSKVMEEQMGPAVFWCWKYFVSLCQKKEVLILQADIDDLDWPALQSV